jgi:hypothetical protein
MFRTLFAHSQQVLHIRHLVYCVRAMSVGCSPEDEQIMLETCRGP